MVSDLRRDQGGRGQALELYRRGEELARRAKHPAYQAKALIGQVRVESTRLGIPNWGAAANHIEQAIRLCEPLKDKTLLFEALDYAARVQIGRGNLRGAAATLERALTLAPKIGDPFLLYISCTSTGPTSTRCG